MHDPTILVVFAVAIAAMVLSFLWQRNRIAQIRAEYANDPDVEVAESSWQFRMQTRPPHRSAVCRQAGGGKNDPARWEIQTSAQLRGGLTLSLSKEGMFGGLREAIGFKDIHVGDAEFDRAFTIRGNDEEAIAALLSDGFAKQAIWELFAANAWNFRIDGNGGVHCRAARGTLNGEQPKRLLLAVTVLCDALEGKVAGSSASPLRSTARY